MESTNPADLIVTNAKVATLDATDRLAQAVAIKGDRFLAVGSVEEIERFAVSETRRIDAGGKLVVPGLIDGHAHLDREGLKEILPSLSGCSSIADVLDRIREIAAQTPKGEWIVTMPIGVPQLQHLATPTVWRGVADRAEQVIGFEAGRPQG